MLESRRDDIIFYKICVVTNLLGLSFLLMFYSHTLRSLARTHNDGATGGEGFLFLSSNANKGENIKLK